MRGILFRAYQKNFKRMLPIVSVDFHKGVIEQVTVDNRGINGEYDVIPWLSTYRAKDDDYPLDSLILMQYTGIEDRDGIKIFEGDILEDTQHGVRYTVFFVDGGFVIESNPKYFGYGEQGGVNPTEELSNMQTRQYVEGAHKVVGNIYNNKELLKQ